MISVYQWDFGLTHTWPIDAIENNFASSPRRNQSDVADGSNFVICKFRSTHKIAKLSSSINSKLKIQALLWCFCQELSTVMRSLGLQASQSELEEMMTEADEDGSGRDMVEAFLN